jgi:addiction module RelE/StbE family toxin
MRLSWRERALDDVENLRDYIAADNSFYAKIFVNKIIEIAEKLIDFPKMGRIVPEYGNDDIREILYRDYRIIYEILNGEIYIITVIHGSRRLDL